MSIASRGGDTSETPLIVTRIVLALLVIGLAAGTALDAVGFAPWLLIASVGTAMTFLFGQRVSWPLALATAIVAMLAGYAVIARLYPLIDLPLADKNRALLVVIGVAVIARLWTRRASLRAPRQGAVMMTALFGIPVLVVGGVVLVIIAASGGVRASWAMHSDAVWNTMMARFIWADGGIDIASHLNSSPMTAALLAASFAGGRSGVPSAELLQHDVGRQAELWVIMAALSSVLAGIIALRSLRGVRQRYRLLAAVLVALIPTSWFGLGLAIEFGFYNATISLVILLCAWLAWIEARISPLVSACTLGFAAVALLATWAPLAGIPVALAAVALVAREGEWWKGLRGSRLLACGAAILSVPLYGVLVTLPDLNREGEALGQDGGIFGIAPAEVLIVFAVAIVLAIASAIGRGQRHELLGVILVIGMSVLGLGYLLMQRTDAENIWGYYPAKMGWMVVVLLLVIIAVSAFGWAELIRPRQWASLAALASTGLLVGALMLQVAPTRITALPLLSMVSATGLSYPDAATRTLFALSDPTQKNMALRLNTTAGVDAYVNRWLLQQHSDAGDDPIRLYAYVLDPANVTMVCDAISAWGGEVIAHTADSGLEAELEGACVNGAPTVVLHADGP